MLRITFLAIAIVIVTMAGYVPAAASGKVERIESIIKPME